MDTSNIKWPKVVTTLYGAWLKGDGSETLSCQPAYKADARLEAR